MTAILRKTKRTSLPPPPPQPTAILSPKYLMQQGRVYAPRRRRTQVHDQTSLRPIEDFPMKIGTTQNAPFKQDAIGLVMTSHSLSLSLSLSLSFSLSLSVSLFLSLSLSFSLSLSLSLILSLQHLLLPLCCVRDVTRIPWTTGCSHPRIA
jgi:hypothetical protein